MAIFYYFCRKKHKNKFTMARPIKETPILTDDDAERFVERAENVEKMSKETRAANRAKFLERVAEANKHIEWSLNYESCSTNQRLYVNQF